MSEGKKTVSFEICEQLAWQAPDAIFVSVGDGCICLLYTSDAADERSSVDLGGRRIIKKKNNGHVNVHSTREDI